MTASLRKVKGMVRLWEKACEGEGEGGHRRGVGIVDRIGIVSWRAGAPGQRACRAGASGHPQSGPLAGPRQTHAATLGHTHIPVHRLCIECTVLLSFML